MTGTLITITSYFITNILAGSVSPGLDAPRMAGSFPSEVSSVNFQPPEVRPIPDSLNLQVSLVFITCHFGKILKVLKNFIRFLVYNFVFG
jgi:hypothetical protein